MLPYRILDCFSAFSCIINEYLAIDKADICIRMLPREAEMLFDLTGLYSAVKRLNLRTGYCIMQDLTFLRGRLTMFVCVAVGAGDGGAGHGALPRRPQGRHPLVQVSSPDA